MRQSVRQGAGRSERIRPAITAPRTVALAVIQVAQPRLFSQVLSDAVATVGHSMTPRPYPRPNCAAPAPAAIPAAAPACDVQPFSAMPGTVLAISDVREMPILVTPWIALLTELPGLLQDSIR